MMKFYIQSFKYSIKGIALKYCKNFKNQQGKL